MPNREKVIKGLECCLSGKYPPCGERGYDGDMNYNDCWSCRLPLMADVLVLLKAQEPMVLAGTELTEAELIEKIRKAPIVMKPIVDAVSVVHARWLYEHDDPVMLPCSACGYEVYRYNNTPYCPNCGAKMDKEAR